MNSESNSACITAGTHGSRPSVKRTHDQITATLADESESEGELTDFPDGLEEDLDEAKDCVINGKSLLPSTAKPSYATTTTQSTTATTTTLVSDLVSSPVTTASIKPSLLINKTKKKKSRHILSPTKAVAPLVKGWLLTHYDVGAAAEGYSVPRSALYDHFVAFAEHAGIRSLNAATFGKLMRWICPDLKTRRLGTRGASKYHYYGIKPKHTIDISAATSTTPPDAEATATTPIPSTPLSSAAAAAILTTPPPPAGIAIPVQPPRKRQRTAQPSSVAVAAKSAKHASTAKPAPKASPAPTAAEPNKTTTTTTTPSSAARDSSTPATNSVAVKPPAGFPTTPVSANSAPAVSPSKPASTRATQLTAALMLDTSGMDTAGDDQLATNGGLCGLALDPAVILIRKYRDYIRGVATAIAAGRFAGIEEQTAKFWSGLPFHLAHRYLAVPTVVSALAVVDDAAFAALGQSLINAAAAAGGGDDDDGARAIDTGFLSQLLAFCGQWECIVARALEGPPLRVSLSYATAAREDAARHGRALGAAAQVALLAGEAAALLRRAGQPQKMLADWTAAAVDEPAASEVARLLARNAPVGDWLDWVRQQVAEPASTSAANCRDALAAWQGFVAAALAAVSTATSAAFHVLFSLLNQYVLYFLEANSAKLSARSTLGAVDVKVEPSTVAESLDQSDPMILAPADVQPIDMGLGVAEIDMPLSTPAADDASLDCFERSRFEPPTPVVPPADDSNMAPLLSCAYMPPEVEVDMSVAEDAAAAGFGAFEGFAAAAVTAAPTTAPAASAAMPLPSFMAQLDAFFETSNQAPAGTADGCLAY